MLVLQNRQMIIIKCRHSAILGLQPMICLKDLTSKGRPIKLLEDRQEEVQETNSLQAQIDSRARTSKTRSAMNQYRAERG